MREGTDPNQLAKFNPGALRGEIAPAATANAEFAVDGHCSPEAFAARVDHQQRQWL